MENLIARHLESLGIATNIEVEPAELAYTLSPTVVYAPVTIKDASVKSVIRSLVLVRGPADVVLVECCVPYEHDNPNSSRYRWWAVYSNGRYHVYFGFSARKAARRARRLVTGHPMA